MRLIPAQVLLVSLFLCAGCHDQQEREFRTVEEARQNQMVVKGWLPSVTPDDTTLIHFDSDLDAGSVVGRFQSSDARPMRSQCIPAKSPLRLPRTRPQWFPKDLQNARTTAALEHDGYEIFECPENFILAVHAAGHVVFYWSVRNVVAH
jgi:hypothetical protein